MDPNAGSQYKKKYGMDVKFVLLEDPAAKFAAFRSGQIDIMWNTVDNWAREASMSPHRTRRRSRSSCRTGRAAATASSRSRRSSPLKILKGKKIACTQFTPSHFLLLYLLAQSGLTPETAPRREEHYLLHRRPRRGRSVQSEQVDAAVTWEPDLSGAVTARGDEAHVLVSTQAATNIIADTLCARQD